MFGKKKTNKKKLMYENELREVLSYNNYLIKYKNDYPDKIEYNDKNKDVEMGGIMCLSERYVLKMIENQVDMGLLMDAKESQKLAKLARDELNIKISNHKKENNDNEKIRLYKKAILELKQEGKI